MSGRRGDTDSPWRGRQRLDARCRQSHRQLRMFIEPEDRHPPFSRYGRIALSRNEKSGRGSLSFQWRIFEFLSVVPRPLFATAETRDHDEDPQRRNHGQFLHHRLRTKHDPAFFVAVTLSRSRGCSRCSPNPAEPKTRLFEASSQSLLRKCGD